MTRGGTEAHFSAVCQLMQLQQQFGLNSGAELDGGGVFRRLIWHCCELRPCSTYGRLFICKQPSLARSICPAIAEAVLVSSWSTGTSQAVRRGLIQWA